MSLGADQVTKRLLLLLRTLTRVGEPGFVNGVALIVFDAGESPAAFVATTEIE